MSTRTPITDHAHDRPEPAAHTPGPWKVGITDDGELIVDLRPQHKGFSDIIAFGDLEDTEGEDHANAALVAAAPELLALAIAVATHFQDTDTPLGAQARATIAKATGQVTA